MYVETDALIGRLCESFPDASIAVFAMHGMGDNGADVPTMVLLPELLYRRAFGRPWMREIPWSDFLPDGTPLLAEQQTWHQAMEARIPTLWSDAVKEARARAVRQEPPIAHAGIDWRPASRYRPFWPDMEAFAMPSFYDGRARLNLKGRERFGNVTPDRHRRLLDEIRTLLGECVDPITSKPVVAGFSESSKPPLDVGPTESDLYVYWEGLALGFAHPELGRIGPVPFRRTGGHSGPFGFLYCVHSSLPAGNFGEASSFDVMPTLAAILREAAAAAQMSGKSLLR